MRNIRYLIGSILFAVAGVTLNVKQITVPPSFNIGGIASWESKNSGQFQHYEVPVVRNFHEARVQFDLNYNLTADKTVKILNFGNSLESYSLSISKLGEVEYLIAEKVFDSQIFNACTSCKPEKIIIKMEPLETKKDRHQVTLNISETTSETFLQINKISFKFAPQNDNQQVKAFTPSLDYGNLSGERLSSSDEINISNLQSGTSRNQIIFSGTNIKLIFTFISIFLFLQIKFNRKQI